MVNMESLWSKLWIINPVTLVQMCGQWGNGGMHPSRQAFESEGILGLFVHRSGGKVLHFLISEALCTSLYMSLLQSGITV